MRTIAAMRRTGRPRARSRSMGRLARLAVPLLCASLVAAACSASGGSGGGGSNQVFTTTAAWGPTSWTYNPHGTGYFAGFGVLLPLAFVEKTPDRSQMFQLIPQLMTGYAVNSRSHTLTVHLVNSAKFSNGEPVNASDLINTILLSMMANQFVPNIKNLTAPNSTTVVLTLTPATGDGRGLLAAEATTPLPMSQYGQFLPAGMEQTLLSYAHLVQNPKTTASAESSPQYKKIAPYIKKLADYSPKKLIGDGPFMVTGANTSSITEAKSPSYFGASHVHVGKVTLLNAASSASVYPQLFNHGIDWYGDATPSSTEYRQAKTDSDLHVFTVDNDVVENMLINNKAYPFTLTPVRQAVAYLINRTKLAETEDGGMLTDSRPDSLPDGLGSLLNGIWLSPSQRSQLNPYPNSPAKATALLESAGFKKASGHWMMPDGKQFKTQVIAPASPGNASLFATETAAELTAFGISASASTVPTASYPPQYEKGNFQIAWVLGVNSNLEPVCGIANGGLGAPYNYAFGANNVLIRSQPGIGFGPAYQVPGMGTVQVSQTIIAQCQGNSTGAKLAGYAWDWAQVVNKEVPFLTYADDEAVNFYSTASFTGWPPASSWLWQESGIYAAQALQMMIENGYIHPAGS
jgi:peptide/nickel transport system substrate-binding protein